MAKYTFQNKKQLLTTLNNQFKKTLDNVAKRCLEELEERVARNMYEHYTPTVYRRTIDIFDSISKTEVIRDKNEFLVAVYFNPQKIVPKIYEGAKWNAHADFWGNPIEAHTLIKWLEEGTNNKYYSHEGYEFFKDTVEFIQSNLNEMVRTELIKLGFTLT